MKTRILLDATLGVILGTVSAAAGQRAPAPSPEAPKAPSDTAPIEQTEPAGRGCGLVEEAAASRKAAAGCPAGQDGPTWVKRAFSPDAATLRRAALFNDKQREHIGDMSNNLAQLLISDIAPVGNGRAVIAATGISWADVRRAADAAVAVGRVAGALQKTTPPPPPGRARVRLGPE